MIHEQSPTLSYVDGVIDGVRMYAYWKDGEQYVGTSGTTLKEAITFICETANHAIDQAHATQPIQHDTENGAH